MTTTTSNGRPDEAGKRVQACASGLHGHRLEDSAVRADAAEFLGTFVLVLAIISTAIAAELSEAIAGSPYDSLAVPLAGGFTLVVVVASLGHLSGAHLNPAVTVGLVLNRRFPMKRVPGYLVAQLPGAILAALAAWLLFGSKARSVASLGAILPAAGVGIGRVFSAEGTVTFVFVLVVLAVGTGPLRAPKSGSSGHRVRVGRSNLHQRPDLGRRREPCEAPGTHGRRWRVSPIGGCTW